MKSILTKILIITCFGFFLCLSLFVLFIHNNKFNDAKTETELKIELEIETENIDEIVEKKEITSDDIMLKNVGIGDVVEFGRFYDKIVDDDIEKKNIKWKVLDKIDDFALLMSVDVLKTLPYHETWNAITWEKCTLRSWINNDFYDIAFNDFEKELIKTVENENIGNSYTDIKEDYVTKDRVFILSIDEVKKYFDQYKIMMAVGTDYAKSEGLWVSKYNTSVGYSVWWLRSPGKTKSFASLMHAGGSIGAVGDGVATKGNGIRPCIWVKVG